MRPITLSLSLAAFPPVLASLAVLAIADVGRNIWLVHLLAIGFAFALAMTGGWFLNAARTKHLALSIIVLTLLGLAAPLLTDSLGPNRWVSLGPLNLYMAPFLLPAFLAACSVYANRRNNYEIVAFISIPCVALLLAMQPDASQTLALLVSSALIFVKSSSNVFRSVMTLALTALITAWAFTLPDPLQPVPYVEDVFRFTLDYSLFVGITVIACAVALVMLLAVNSFKGAPWLLAVASYYAVLFMCSIAGLTPAPLIGYGSGPILGFALMAAVMQAIKSEMSTNDGICTSAE